ncbi:MAG: NUDIX hydrolase [Ignavibacteriales bacterium]|nr:NUDIX hydrolase [Ignavibacteriales bacterium]
MAKNSNQIIKNLSTDCVIFGFDNSELKVLVIKLAVEPGKGEWALPGSNILQEENLDIAAKRVLKELTGLDNVYMEQLYTFGDVYRFPLFRVVTVAYFALVKIEDYKPEPGPKVSDAQWFSIKKLPKLPFDHNEIINYALKRLKQRVRIRPIGFELLPLKFTLSQLQNLYETIMDFDMDKRNFRKKILGMNVLVPLEKQKGVPHRAAKLYRFDKRKYDSLKEKGYNFEI